MNVRVKEGEKERIQAFEGVCIARRGSGVSETFTVRKISNGVGVERIFPVHSPMLADINVVRRGRVRRAKLYYLRDAHRQGGAHQGKEGARRGRYHETGAAGVTPHVARGAGSVEPIERELRRTGGPLIAGVDEVGRGSLAGPVVACAVIMPPDVRAIAGVDDSKAARRRRARAPRRP